MDTSSASTEKGATLMAQPVHLSVKESFIVWRKGVLWSFLTSLAVLMESYDMILLNSLYAAPPFQEAYGVLQPNGKYIIPAPWQSGLNAGQNVALIIGIFIGAPLADRWGQRKVMMAGLIFVFAFKFLIFFSTGLPQLLAGYIIGKSSLVQLWMLTNAIVCHSMHSHGLLLHSGSGFRGGGGSDRYSLLRSFVSCPERLFVSGADVSNHAQLRQPLLGQ